MKILSIGGCGLGVPPFSIGSAEIESLIFWSIDEESSARERSALVALALVLCGRVPPDFRLGQAPLADGATAEAVLAGHDGRHVHVCWSATERSHTATDRGTGALAEGEDAVTKLLERLGVETMDDLLERRRLARPLKVFGAQQAKEVADEVLAARANR